jgi:hypothetical protein
MAMGQHVVISTKLPPLDEEGQLILILEALLETIERKLRNTSIKEYMIKWKTLPIEDATWEGEKILQHHRLQLLEERKSWAGEDCNVHAGLGSIRNGSASLNWFS